MERLTLNTKTTTNTKRLIGSKNASDTIPSIWLIPSTSTSSTVHPNERRTRRSAMHEPGLSHSQDILQGAKEAKPLQRLVTDIDILEN